MTLLAKCDPAVLAKRNSGALPMKILPITIDLFHRVSYDIARSQTGQRFSIHLPNMKKGLFLLILCSNLLGLSCANAQLVNGSFTSGYTGWTLVGIDPSASPDTASPPPDATADALISSTSSAYEGDPTNGANSATASQLEAAFGNITLPGSSGSSTVVDGQAIYQTFTLSASASLTFEFASGSSDYSDYDRVGYVLQDVSNPQNSDFHGLPNSSAYSTISPIALVAGTYKLGFIAYNTGDNYSPTHINVTEVDVSEAPEPSTWLLLVGGCALLAWMARRGSSVHFR